MDMPEPGNGKNSSRRKGRRRLRTATPLATSGEIEVWLSNNGGWIALAWINRGTVRRWDDVGLFDHNPVDPLSYFDSQWQYNRRPFTPMYRDQRLGPQYWIAYAVTIIRKTNYVIEQSDGPFNL